MSSLVGWFVWAEVEVPDVPGGNDNLLLYGGMGAAVLVLLLVVVFVRRGKKPKGGSEEGLAEDLRTFPPPPKQVGHYQLLVLGQPVRLRLVVVAPVGKKPVGKVDSVLEQVLRGLGEVSIDDRARLRAWPAQLSTAGFMPTFFRLVQRPDPEGKPSRWVLLAGPAKAGATPVLVGLACLADVPCKLGNITVDELQWSEVLRVETA